MREKLNPLIKFCATRTIPAAETKSKGLQANASAGPLCATGTQHQYYQQ